jgi:tetratricopeptide (TPR) repeat protein
MDASEHLPREETPLPETAGTPPEGAEEAAVPGASPDSPRDSPPDSHMELPPDSAAAPGDTALDSVVESEIPPPSSAPPSSPSSSWFADNWRWVAASVLVFAVLMYPIAKRVMGSAAARGNAAAPSADAPALPDLLTLSLQYYQAKRYQEAVAVATAGLQLNPKSADLYNNLGVSYAGLGQYDQAVASLEMALRINPDYQLAKNNLAWITSQKQQATGQGTFKEGTVEYYVNQSLTQYQAGQYQEAIAAAQQALKLRPDMAEAYNNMCVSYLGLHQYDQAIQSCGNALRLRPDFALAKNNLMWAVSEKQKAGGGSTKK